MMLLSGCRVYRWSANAVIASEADLVKAKVLLHDWKLLWGKATPEERQDIVAALFGEVRVRDKAIVSATLADPSYAPLIASSEARRLRLVEPDEREDEQVGLAPPDGLGGARPTFSIEGVDVLVMGLLAA